MFGPNGTSGQNLLIKPPDIIYLPLGGFMIPEWFGSTLDHSDSFNEK